MKKIRCNENKSYLMVALMALLLNVLSSPLYAESSAFEIGGSARVRAESKNDADFNGSASDYLNFIGSRFRLDMKFKPNENVNIFFQPQFSKVWGDPELVPTAPGVNTPTNSSGATSDTGLDVHQAYVNYAFTEPLSLLAGRKELNYGDQLLVGGVGWSNVGRAFDLLQGTYHHSTGSIEAFTAKVKDTNVSTNGPGDRNFSGLYSANKLGEYFQNVDGYVFYLKDTSVLPGTSVTAYGLRLSSPISAFDYRVEVTFENVSGAALSSNENQLDLEFGYTFDEAAKSRVSVEYFAASNDFDQLFPTAHKWLGYADLFSRRNIEGFRVGVGTQVAEKWTVSLDYHNFNRQDTTAPAYKLNGTAYGAIGNDSAIASEMDLIVGYKLQGNVNLEVGASRANPGAYLKANGGTDAASFYYFQASTSF